MMIPSENYFSENSDPQRLFYPAETVMVSAKTKFPSFSKSDILQNAPFYPLNMLPCCSFSFKQFCIVFSCTSKKILETVLMYVQDILTATRTFSWYMWISWENSDDILTQSDGIFPQTQYITWLIGIAGRNPPKSYSYFTLKREIKVPATQNTLNTHITQKMDLATCTMFFFRWFPAFMVNVGKCVFLT